MKRSNAGAPHNSRHKLLPSFLPTNEFTTMPPNPALNRTGRYVHSCLSASARPAG